MAMIEEGSRVEIMYPNLFKGLGHKLEDLSKYDVSLVGFDGKTIVLRGMIRLLFQTREDVVNADFIMVKAYSPYMAILARPWLHALGAVSSTLHVKLKYPTEGGVWELLGCQTVARQCMVVAIRHQASKIGSLESTPTYSYQCPSCQPPWILQYHVRVWIRLPLAKTRRGTSKLCNINLMSELHQV